jgi:hypothetical protein
VDVVRRDEAPDVRGETPDASKPALLTTPRALPNALARGGAVLLSAPRHEHSPPREIARPGASWGSPNPEVGLGGRVPWQGTSCRWQEAARAHDLGEREHPRAGHLVDAGRDQHLPVSRLYRAGCHHPRQHPGTAGDSRSQHATERPLNAMAPTRFVHTRAAARQSFGSEMTPGMVEQAGRRPLLPRIPLRRWRYGHLP